MQNDIYANPVGNIKKDIYLITNTINGKQYVGQSLDAIRRFSEHCKNYTEDISLLNRAIKKYGKENFTMQILESQIENYNEREKYWISIYKTLQPNGYNLTIGGESPPILTGNDHPNTVISDECVLMLKNDLKSTTLSFRELSKKYGISKKHVMRINEGVSRAQPSENYPLRENPNINGKLTEEDVDAIIDMLRYTYLLDGQIARKFGVDVRAISNINSGKTHKRDDLHYPIRKWKSCGTVLFTYEQVTEIIDLLINSTMSLNRIAKRYNVYVQSIQIINNGSSKKYRRDGIQYPIRKYDKSCNDYPREGE